ncbi:hypothetical protein D3C84_958260 [compost metagenome]
MLFLNIPSQLRFLRLYSCNCVGNRLPLIEQARDLVKPEPHVLERLNLIEPNKLIECIVAVARIWINMGGLQQPQIVIMPKRSDCHLGNGREEPDFDQLCHVQPSSLTEHRIDKSRKAIRLLRMTLPGYFYA